MKKKVNKTKRGHLVFLCMTCLTLSACHPVPIQMARMHQIDFYKQTFTIPDSVDAVKTLQKLIGERNYRLIKLPNMRGGKMKEYLSQIEIRGALNFSIYLNPNDIHTFFVDAFGRYSLIYKTSGDILLTSDFYIKNNQFTEDDLKKGEIRLRVEQSLVRHSYPDSVKYFEPDSSDKIIFNIKMANLPGEDDVYRINYEEMHEVRLNGDMIGYLKYDALPANKYKIIDLRGRNFLKKHKVL